MEKKRILDVGGRRDTGRNVEKHGRIYVAPSRPKKITGYGWTDGWTDHPTDTPSYSLE